MDKKNELYMFNYSFLKFLGTFLPLIIFNIIFSIHSFIEHQKIIGILYVDVAIFFFALSALSSNIFPIIIKNDEIMLLKYFFGKNRYDTYSLKDVVTYKITKFSIKIKLESNMTIYRPYGFLYTKDREFLKQLLAEKVPVKPS